jgi:hypothetical protein
VNYFGKRPVLSFNFAVGLRPVWKDAEVSGPVFQHIQYARKSLAMRGAPLSITIDSGYPWTANVALLIILAVVMQFRMLTSTHLE